MTHLQWKIRMDHLFTITPELLFLVMQGGKPVATGVRLQNTFGGPADNDAKLTFIKGDC